jgi:hypothetical protein
LRSARVAKLLQIRELCIKIGESTHKLLAIAAFGRVFQLALDLHARKLEYTAAPAFLGFFGGQRSIGLTVVFGLRFFDLAFH